MNSLLQRLMAVSMLALSVSACTTAKIHQFGAPSPETSSQNRRAPLLIIHPDRQDDFDYVWEELRNKTIATPVSDGRVLIQSKATPFASDNAAEQFFLVRAAVEALNANKDGFVVLQLEYYKTGISLPSLIPDINLSSRQWIGNYEGFAENRNEQNLFASRKRIKNMALDGVVLLLDKEDYPNRDRFDAGEIYVNLLGHQAN